MEKITLWNRLKALSERRGEIWKDLEEDLTVDEDHAQRGELCREMADIEFEVGRLEELLEDNCDSNSYIVGLDYDEVMFILRQLNILQDRAGCALSEAEAGVRSLDEDEHLEILDDLQLIKRIKAKLF